jgi:hypothetical protein
VVLGLGYEVANKFDVCEACSVGKSRQKISTKNGKEEVQSLESVCTLTLVQSMDLALVDLNSGS